MKKILLIVVMMISALCANAQFEQGTRYVGANLSGLGLSYNKASEFNFGVGAEAGYFIEDGWMLRGNISYQLQHKCSVASIGAGARYYFTQNGVFMGAGLAYERNINKKNDLTLPLEVGYCFYLDHKIAIEPAVYYKMSFSDFADCSTIGLRIGIGYFF